jgi:saccharopine dehydrogenase-like NADP-dependent oxidoreductase
VEEERTAAAAGSQTKRVVILGGTGRVGSATAAALVRQTREKKKKDKQEEEEDGLSQTPSVEVEVVIAGRRPERAQSARESWPAELGSVPFEQCDINDPQSLDRVIYGADLVVHAAGPFQQTSSCSVLEAAIRNKIGGYVDVCDDAEHTKRAKVDLGASAAEKGVSAVVSCGVYPGLSNVMAAYMCEAEAGSPFPDSKAEKLRFSYFTAGSGGVGATILATTFLLLGERATQFVDGKRKTGDPYAERNVVEFGQKLGKREVFNLNLPEVFTAHEVKCFLSI